MASRTEHEWNKLAALGRDLKAQNAFGKGHQYKSFQAFLEAHAHTIDPERLKKHINGRLGPDGLRVYPTSWAAGPKPHFDEGMEIKLHQWVSWPGQHSWPPMSCAIHCT